MKNVYKKIITGLTLILVILTSSDSYGQCGLNILGYTLPPSSGTVFVNTSYGPGYYFNFPMLNGGSYAVTTCGAAYDTQVSGWHPTTVTSIFYNNDNGPLCAGTAASVDNYIPNFTGYARVQISRNNCLSNSGGGSSIVVGVRQNNNLAFTSATTALCSGQTRTLVATPANVGTTPGGYGNPGTFTGTGLTGSTFLAPTVSVATVYTFTYTFGYVSTTHTLMVNPLPTVTASAVSTLVCTGSEATLNGSGANTYAWSGAPGILDGVPFTPTLPNGSYTVVGTSLAGCTSTNLATISISLVTLPLITASAAPPVVCSGFPTILNGGGATTYVWSGGVTNGVSFVPTASGSYTVVGTLASTGCTNSAVQQITVNALPTITINLNNPTICLGQSVTLTAGGATTYTWTGAVTNGVSFAPGVTTTYSVTGTDGNNCVGSNTITISVDPCTGINNLVQIDKNNIRIFPNPSTNEFNIQASTYTELSIINELGQVAVRVVLNDQNDYKATIKDLPKGVYFVTGKNQEVQIPTQKVVITE